MNRITKGWFFGIAALAIAGNGTPAEAAVATLTATLTVVTMPSTITLCRDPAAEDSADAQWQVFIDVDSDPATGDANGSDVLLLATTTPQPLGCSPHTASTQENLVANALEWNGVGFVDSGANADVVIDTSTGTLAITTELAGPLATLDSNAPLRAAAIASYTTAGAEPTLAGDGALGTFGTQTTDPAQDVQFCTAPCTQTASWIELIDLTAVAAATSEPLPVFGANTLTVEFDVASLPANLSLCRYPAVFADSQGSDYAWLAGFYVDGNPNTGLGSIDTQIVISSPLQSQGCTTHSVAIEAALSAGLEVWDEAQQAFVFAGDLPLTIDAAAGKLFVQADRTAQGLTGVSSTSVLAEQTAGLYAPSGPPFFAYDQSPLMQLGVAYADPLHDVLNCTSPCSTAVDWYPQIDLVGGSIHLADEIFSNGFE